MFLPLSPERAALALVLMTSPAFAGGVRIVDASGQRNFQDIQSAIDAAVDGDVLLVGAGTYPSFTIDGKGISIFAAPPGALVRVLGTVDVTNVHAQGVAIVGIRAEPDPAQTQTERLHVTQCSALVAFQGCAFLPGHYTVGQPGGSLLGQHCAVVQNCPAVVFSGCSFTGGAGAYLGPFPVPGGIGLRLQSSTVATYGCTTQGGKGGNSNQTAGTGGAGLRSESSWLFASGCSVTGGAGGDGIPPNDWADVCGSGGNGLELDAASEGHLLDIVCTGGQLGQVCLSGGSSGLPISAQGLLDQLAGTARTFGLAAITADRAPWNVSVSGVAGDQIFLNRSLAPVFQYEPALSGVCTSLLPPFAQVAPYGVVPFSGSLVVATRQRLLPDDVIARLNYLQGYVIETGGATVLGSPMHTLSLNWNALPDCNSNGIQDYAEVIAGITADVDHDLIPDGCP